MNKSKKSISNSKKSQVNVSFSWIFMIIIGSFFIIMAYNIIGKYQEVEEYKYEVELKKTFRVIMNNVGRTSGIESNVLESIGNVFKDRKVELECVGGKSVLSINDGEIMDTSNEYLQNYPIFMTKISQGTIANTYMAAESFFMPFKITNMLAIVSKKNLIIFDSDSEISEKLIYKFDKGSYRNLSYFEEDFEELDVTNFMEEYVDGRSLDSIMFVSDSGKSINTLLSEIPEEIMTYHLKINETVDTFGSLQYFNRSNELVASYNYSNWKEEYLTLPTMAIFSNPQTFECSYNLLLETIPTIYEFYILKAKKYESISSNQIICSSTIAQENDYYRQEFKYNTIVENLKTIKNHAKVNKFENIADLHRKLNKLSSDNKNLEEFNCPYIY